MRELRSDQHAAVAKRRHRTLLVQRLWTLPQDERHESAADQTEQKTGELNVQRKIIFQNVLAKFENIFPVAALILYERNFSPF